jgi:lysozyme family protein
MDNFNTAFEFSMKKEGCESDDPADAGGKTRYGISSVYHPKMWQNGPPSWDQAREFYRAQFWDKCRCPELPSGLDIAVFDAAIPSGIDDAARWLQAALKVKVDGVIGSKTLLAASKVRPEPIIRAITISRQQHYARLKTYPRFGAGWFGRALDCYSLAMAKVEGGANVCK